MKSYAPHYMVDAAAFILASHIALDESRVDQRVSRWNWKNIVKATMTTTGLKTIPNIARTMLKRPRGDRIPTAPRERISCVYYELVRRVDPDGSPRKKFLGIFGGTRFGPRYAHPADRKILSKPILPDTSRWHV